MPKTIDDLTNWDLFVLRHRNPVNIRIHLISVLIFWLGPVLALIHSPWWWIAFFGSGLVGSIGHYISDDGKVDAREATSSVRVIFFASKMALLFLVGRYGREVSQSEQKIELYERGQISSRADEELFVKLGH